MPGDFDSYKNGTFELFQTIGKSLRGKDASMVLGALALLAGYSIHNFFPERDPQTMLDGFMESVKKALDASADIPGQPKPH